MEKVEADPDYTRELAPVTTMNNERGLARARPLRQVDVLIVRKLTDAQKDTLSLPGRVKLWAHGGRQAHAEFADRCHGCGLCVTACPQKAISLKRSNQSS